MMQTVGKPYLFQISLEGFKVGILAVSVIIYIDGLEEFAGREIVFTILVP